ncbi:MAG: exo-alpha-sialidase, partial [Ignavibacteriae bacterium]|nr:exo-alpha-sialidase [Ignavibacteriota bacterium]
NLGFVPTEVFLVRSCDYGHTWGTPQKITPPLIGPSFEACSPIIILKDGRWLWPTSTWRGWDGYCPNGMKMVAWVSYDKGKTWPEYMNVMDDSQRGVIYWESKIIELSKGTMIGTAWAYDERRGEDLANHYTISIDSGRTWSKPRTTGLFGQTMAISELPDGRLLVVYRRMDKPGLWVTIVHIKSGNWINEREFPLWGVQESSLTNKSNNMVHDFNNLKFGAPCITFLPDQSVYISFWCYENFVSNIRWLKLNI